MNPQYRLSVPSELNAEGATCVFITLTQRRPDLGDATAAALKYIALCAKRGQAGGTAWSAPNSMSAIREMGSDFVTSGALKNDLTVSMELLNLSVDEQVSLMAATFEAEDETEFVLRVYCPMCTLKLRSGIRLGKGRRMVCGSKSSQRGRGVRRFSSRKTEGGGREEGINCIELPSAYLTHPGIARTLSSTSGITTIYITFESNDFHGVCHGDC